MASPMTIKAQEPMSGDNKAVVERGRKGVRHIMRGNDDRLLVVVGPCSIHDVAMAKEYALKLAV